MTRMKLSHFGFELPEELLADADKWRNFLIEEVASFDDVLMEKYLNEEGGFLTTFFLFL